MLKRIFIISLLILIGLKNSPCQNDNSAERQKDNPAEQIYEQVSPSVVIVIGHEENNFENQGSGVVIDDGLLLTNYHIISDAKNISVFRNGKEITGVQVIGQDVQKDLALLKFNAAGSSFPKISLYKGEIKPGQKIYTISSPEGYENTITEGIVSGIRNHNGQTMIQITAPIANGSSGGALLNSNGELIGILTSGQHAGHLYFAITISEVNKLLAVLIDKPEDNTESSDYLEEAMNANSKGKYDEAVNYYSLHLEKYSDDSKAYFNRGLSYGKLKDYENEIKDYTKAISLNPEFEEAYIKRAIAFRKSGKPEDALNDLNKAVELDPVSFDAFFNRGITYYYLKNYSLSVKDYSKVLELYPEHINAYYNRGFSYFKLSLYQLAINDWETAVKLYPAYSDELQPKIDDAKTYIR